jgi:ABC-type phosphate transport system substrate-binding protein
MRALGAAALLLTSIAIGEESTNSENNQDGSLNTNTVDSTVSSNNNSTDQSTSNTYNGAGSSSDMPVGSAIAPSYMSNGIETCLQGTGSSIQTGIVGYTTGNYKIDEYCNRRRNAKVLSDLGMKVAAISVMCLELCLFLELLVL